MGGEAGEIKNIGIFNFDQKEKRRNKDDILGGEKKKKTSLKKFLIISNCINVGHRM